MSNKFHYFIILPLFLTFVVSCKDDIRSDSNYLGVSNAYKSFLWCKHVPDTIRKDIVFEFNEDSRKMLDEDVILGLFVKSANPDGKEIFARLDTCRAKLFVDDKLSPDNTIRISPDKELPSVRYRLGIVFPNVEESRIHTWFIKVIDNGGLDRINDYEITGFNPEPVIGQVFVETVKKANPLKIWIIALSSVLILLLVLWCTILQYLFYPRFKIGYILIGEEDSVPQPVKCKGYRLFVLTSGKKRQNAFSRILTGKIRYFDHPGCTIDVIIEPVDKKSVRIMKNSHYTVPLSRLKIITQGFSSEPVIIENRTNHSRIKLQIQ